MTNPERDLHARDFSSPGNAPSWVDEVLGQPATPRSPLDSSQYNAGDLRIPGGAPSPAPGERRSSAVEDWLQQTEAHTRPPVAQAPAAAPRVDAWGDPLPTPPSTVVSTPVSTTVNPLPLAPDITQKKLVAGLLAIVLGSLGVHKFYLGMNNPGVILLSLHIGVWVMAVVLGLAMFFFGVIFTVPLAMLVSTGLAIFGLVEGIIYLTKSDADFQRDYLIGKKPWF